MTECSILIFSNSRFGVASAVPAASATAALLAISLQNIKQYHDEKFDKANFIKNVVLDNILPGDIYAKASASTSAFLRVALAASARTCWRSSSMFDTSVRSMFTSAIPAACRASNACPSCAALETFSW